MNATPPPSLLNTNICMLCKLHFSTVVRFNEKALCICLMVSRYKYLHADMAIKEHTTEMKPNYAVENVYKHFLCRLEFIWCHRTSISILKVKANLLILFVYHSCALYQSL